MTTEPTESTDEDRSRWARQARHFETGVPFNKACGVRVERWDADQVVMHLAHADWLRNSSDGLHGGVVASLADTCGGAVALAATRTAGFVATVSMHISYLAPATGDLVATATCIKPGKRLQVSSVQVTDAAGRAIADATITTMAGAPAPTA